MSSQYGPYGLGCTRVTMVGTKSYEYGVFVNLKTFPSSDCSLKLMSMKMESLVIVVKQPTVNCSQA